MDKLRNLMEAAVREQWRARAPGAAVPEPKAAKSAPDGSLRRAATPGRRPSRGAPAIRSLPVLTETFARNRLVAALPKSSEREVFCLLQAAVVQRLAETNYRVIGVTGPNRGSGKTLTAVNLAISLAVDARLPVMLIDFDLHAPSVNKLFGMESETGVEDCLFNGAAVSDVLFSPAIDGLSVLPARGSCKAFAQVMRSRNLTTLLETIKRSYPEEILLVDLPSMIDATDGRYFEVLVDGLLLVVEDNVTEERDYRRALESIDASKLVGTVLNRVPA